MEERDQKTLERLARAVETVYSSPGKTFWRGFLFGLGRGMGALIGWLILLAITFWVIKITGVADIFNELLETFRGVADTINTIPGR